MIKINYIIPDEFDKLDDIAKYNISICDKFKKADYLELSCISWLKNDLKRNYQDLEQLFRYLNLNSYVIANTIQIIPEDLEINYPNKIINQNSKFDFIQNEQNVENVENEENEEIKSLIYIAKISCMGKEDSLKELLKHHLTYEDNFECLKKSGCLMTKDKEEIKQQIKDVNEISKLLECKLKLDLEFYHPYDSINYIIQDLKIKYDKEPEKIICGEIGTNKVWAIMLDGQIISPIGWIIKNKINTDLNDKKNFEYELIDFRKIKIDKI
jgi:hypothetical protein